MDQGGRIEVEDRGGAGVGRRHFWWIAGDEKDIVNSIGPVAYKAALQAYDVEIAGGEVRNEFQGVATGGRPVQVLAVSYTHLTLQTSDLV